MIKDLEHSEFIKLVSAARLAPSVHNVQPWHFKLSQNSEIEINLAKERLLQDGDPTGRETWISIGCAVENIAIFAEEQGLILKDVLTKLNTESLTLRFDRTKNLKRSVLQPFIVKRFTDRSIYTRKSIPLKIIKKLESVAGNNTYVTITTDKVSMAKAADWTLAGMKLALSSQSFRYELTNLMSLKAKNGVGFTAKSLRIPPSIFPIVRWRLKNGKNISQQIELDKKRLDSASALAFVFTAGDNKKYWIDAGRAYQRLCLVATSEGLRHSTHASLVEALDFHKEVADMFKTKYRLQAVVRLGYSNASEVHTPRLPIEKLVT